MAGVVLGSMNDTGPHIMVQILVWFPSYVDIGLGQLPCSTSKAKVT